MFFFQMFTNPPYTYDRAYYTCSYTDTFLIFILIYNPYTIKRPVIFCVSPLNVCGLATFVFDPVLGLGTTTTSSSAAPLARNT